MGCDCGGCGRRVRPRDNYCSHCGSSLRHQRQSPAGQGPNQPRSILSRLGKQPTFLVLGLALLALCLPMQPPFFGSGVPGLPGVSAATFNVECDGEGCAESNSEMLNRIDDLFEAELERQSRISLDEAENDDSGPKEISIFCPSTPEIKIADLPRFARSENECLVLHLTAPDLSSRLVLRCDGEFANENLEP